MKTSKMKIIGIALIYFFASTLKAENNLDFVGELSVYKWIQLTSFPDIKVPVYKSEGTKGPGVLFIHGNSSSSRAFHKQINSEFGRTYKLFFLDLPGHGLATKVVANKIMPQLEGSELPAGFAEYKQGVPEAIKLVANDPDVLAKVVVGWSLGGHVALKAYDLGYLPLVKALFIFGTAPATRYSPIKQVPFKTFGLMDKLGMPLLPSLGLSFKLSPLSEGMFTLDSKFTDSMPWYSGRQFSYYPNRGYAYLTAFFDPHTSFGLKIPDFIMQDGFERSDDRFRTSLAVLALEIDESLSDQPTELDILTKINSHNMTLGVALGERDIFINPNYLQELQDKGYLETLWRNQVQVIPNSGHASQLEQPEEFNQMIKAFIEDLNL